jgi:AcrR family transcriptional regulator
MPTLRDAQKAMTRQLLLDTALDLFESRGFANTTVDEIATRAGTTRVTFYAHFGSRGALMRALIDERLNDTLQRHRTPEGSTEPDLIDAVAAGERGRLAGWLSATAERWPTVNPILRVAREAAVVEDELKDLVDRWMEEAIGDIEAGLAKAGRFDVEVRHFKGVLATAQLDYVARHWPTAGWAITRERMLSELADSWAALLI